MSERVAQYRRKKSQRTLRSNLLLILIAFGVLALAYGLYGFLHRDTLEGQVFLAFGLGFAFLTWALYQCQPWSRWPAAVLTVIMFANGVMSALEGGRHPVGLLITLMHGAIAYWLFLPSTGELFRVSSTPVRSSRRTKRSRRAAR